jgi:hypothetical protein
METPPPTRARDRRAPSTPSTPRPRSILRPSGSFRTTRGGDGAMLADDRRRRSNGSEATSTRQAALESYYEDCGGAKAAKVASVARELESPTSPTSVLLVDAIEDDARSDASSPRVTSSGVREKTVGVDDDANDDDDDATTPMPLPPRARRVSFDFDVVIDIGPLRKLSREKNPHWPGQVTLQRAKSDVSRVVAALAAAFAFRRPHVIAEARSARTCRRRLKAGKRNARENRDYNIRFSERDAAVTRALFDEFEREDGGRRGGARERGETRDDAKR